MKMFTTLATLTFAGATIVGCQTGTKMKSSMPISADALNSMREEFTQADAAAKLGSVDEVLDSQMYLTVGQINPADFPVGTAVAIVDSNKKVVANGNVVRTFESTVHVKYEKVANMRPPHVGDVAVHF